MFNRNPVGPSVRVVMYYNRNTVLDFNATDDAGELIGKTPAEIAAILCKFILSDGEDLSATQLALTLTNGGRSHA